MYKSSPRQILTKFIEILLEDYFQTFHGFETDYAFIFTVLQCVPRNGFGSAVCDIIDTICKQPADPTLFEEHIILMFFFFILSFKKKTFDLSINFPLKAS